MKGTSRHKHISISQHDSNVLAFLGNLPKWLIPKESYVYHILKETLGLNRDL